MQTGYGKMAIEEYAPGKVRMVRGGVVNTRTNCTKAAGSGQSFGKLTSLSTTVSQPVSNPAPSPNIQQFFVPGPLPGANDIIRKHHMVYTKLKTLWGQRIGRVIVASKVQKVDACHIAFEWREQRGNLSHRRDPDNVMFGQKFILDALVQGWILPDDSMDEIRSLTHRVILVDDAPGVLVTLTAEEV